MVTHPGVLSVYWLVREQEGSFLLDLFLGILKQRSSADSGLNDCGCIFKIWPYNGAVGCGSFMVSAVGKVPSSLAEFAFALSYSSSSSVDVFSLDGGYVCIYGKMSKLCDT